MENGVRELVILYDRLRYSLASEGNSEYKRFQNCL
jgi:hypothetical protein